MRCNKIKIPKMKRLNVLSCANGVLADIYHDESDNTITVILKDGRAAGYIETKDIPKPVQEPMTLEEAIKTKEPCVFLEEYGYNEIKAVLLHDFKKGLPYKVYVETLRYDSHIMEMNDYGKTWRCWKEKPTDEEREAAKWDE